MSYRIREATTDDIDVLVHHRIGMFTDMGMSFDVPALEASFRAWVIEKMAAGTYRAWVIDTDDGAVAAGGGISILPWPPSPNNPGDTIAIVYNVYTEPGHRRRGLARQVMTTIHAWASAHGIGSIALNASADGRPLYESMGYQIGPNPMMFGSPGKTQR